MVLSTCVPGVLYTEDHTATVPTLYETLSPLSLERARGAYICGSNGSWGARPTVCGGEDGGISIIEGV